MTMNENTNENTNDQSKPEDIAAAVAEAVNSTGAPTSNEAGGNDSAEPVLSALQSERDQFFESWKRVQAEFENYRRRAQREREQEAKYVALPVIRDLLPGLDNLRRSLDAANKSGKLEDLTKGVEMTLKQIESILEKHEAKPIPGVGSPFDPNLHEAISQMPSAEHPPLTVLVEVEKGYVLHDRVIRPSKVIVSSAPQ
jgi:molecular chaperone GrpE